jgi:uncharacterized protein Yka (UPF0111/DUF47 family)
MFGASSRHDKVFFDGFDRQAAHLLSASGALSEALKNGDVTQTADEIRALQAKAADGSRALIVELRKTWITPFDPEEIRELLVSTDAVMSLINGARERLEAFRLPRKEEASTARELADVLNQCCQAIARGLKLLREKKRDDEIIKACEEVQRLNGRADEIYRAGLAKLYEDAAPTRRGLDGDNVGAGANAAADHDSVARLLSMLKWHEIFDKLDEATTRCSRSALSLETVVSGRS